MAHCIQRCICRSFALLCLLSPSISFAKPFSAIEIEAAMESARGKLQNGSFRAKGKATKVDEYAEIDAEGVWDVSCRFDFLTGSSLTDAMIPWFQFRDKIKSAESIRSLFAVYEGNAYYFSENQAGERPWLAVRAIDANAPNYTAKGFLDVRHLGFSPDENPLRASQVGELVFFGNPHRSGDITSTMEDVGICRLNFVIEESQELFSLWIDCDNGFTPVRFVCERFTMENGVRKPFEVVAEVNTAWKSFDGVFVPVSQNSMEVMTYLPSGMEQRKENLQHTVTTLELGFEWEYVNSTNPELVVDYQTWGLPRGAQVLDERVIPAKFIDPIGIDLPKRPFARPDSHLNYFLWINLGLMLVCIAIFAYRRGLQ